MFQCSICDKNYSCRQNLYKHNKRYHLHSKKPDNIPNDYICIKELSLGLQKGIQKVSLGLHSGLQSGLQEPYETFKCNYCDKSYKHKSNKYRHQKKCKHIKDNSSSSSTINNINNNTTNNTTNIENQNNGTINNTQNTQNVNIYLSIGKEDMANTLTDEEQIEVIKQQFNSLLYLVALTHAGNKYPQFNNSKITDLNRNIGYKYDDETNDFIATDKKEMLDDIVDERTNDINNFMDFHKDKIDKKILKNTQRFIDNINDSENDNNTLLKSHLTKLNHMLYNHTKK